MDERRGALTDSVLDNELQRALTVHPSPEFVARVRMRMARETMTASGWTSRWGYVGAALAATAAVLATIWTSGQGPAPAPIVSRSTAAVQVARAPVVVPGERSQYPIGDPDRDVASRFRRRSSEAIVGSAISRTRRQTNTPQTNTPSDRDDLPEVIVSREDQRAFWNFVAAERAHLLPPMPVRANPDIDPDGEIALPRVEIAPIRIEPLSQIAQMEGDRR